MSELELSPLVQQIEQSFLLIDDVVVMPGQELEDYRGELGRLPRNAHEDVALELVAVGFKFHRLGGEACAKAIHQLMTLAASVLVSRLEVEVLFESVGLLDSTTPARVTGQDAVSKIPVGAQPPAAGSASPLAVRMGKNKLPDDA